MPHTLTYVTWRCLLDQDLWAIGCSPSSAPEAALLWAADWGPDNAAALIAVGRKARVP